jgi:hypothetical protein
MDGAEIAVIAKIGNRAILAITNFGNYGDLVAMPVQSD